LSFEEDALIEEFKKFKKFKANFKDQGIDLELVLAPHAANLGH
jgi:hypothetical protein